MSETLRVVVGSENNVKQEAAAIAFRKSFLASQIITTSHPAQSNVSRMPLSTDETTRGAFNRAVHTMNAHPDADFCVGIEGGRYQDYGSWYLCGSVVVLDRDWQNTRRMGIGHMIVVQIPQKVIDVMNERGVNLGTANDIVYGVEGSERDMGAEGLYTRGLITRLTNCELATIAAITSYRNQPGVLCP